jgi:hypothetical protein
MSSGQKAAYEDAMEKRQSNRERKLKGIDPNQLLTRIESVRDAITRLIASQPSLTRRQHAWLDEAAKQLEQLP